MIIAKKRIDKMDRAKYNPRIELRPGDDEYEKLHGNILRFGMVLPIVWNERTNTVVGGLNASPFWKTTAWRKLRYR